MPSSESNARNIERFVCSGQTNARSSIVSPERSTAPRAAATKFGSETWSSPPFIDAGSATSRKR